MLACGGLCIWEHEEAIRQLTDSDGGVGGHVDWVEVWQLPIGPSIQSYAIQLHLGGAHVPIGCSKDVLLDNETCLHVVPMLLNMRIILMLHMRIVARFQ